MEALLEKKQTLSEARLVINKNPQLTKSFHITSKVPLEKLPKLAGTIKQVEKKLSPYGRVLFRYSGTESKARVMLEGKNKTELKKEEEPKK